MLDAELEKIESFYTAKEKEMEERGRALRVQLDELRDHKIRVQVCLHCTALYKVL